MTSRERVLTTLKHREPDRVPYDLTSTLVTGIHYIAYKKLRKYLGLPERKIEIFDLAQGLARVDEDVLLKLNVDTRGVLTGSPLGWELKIEETENYEQFTDVWGVTWRRPKPHGLYYDMVHHPLKGATLEDARRYKWPNPKDEHRLKGLKEEASTLAKSNCLVVLGTVGMTVGLLQTFQWLLGFEDSFYALAADPPLTHYIVGKLAELDIEFWEWAIPYLGKDIKVVLYADDFGIQTGPVFSYRMFERYFKPWYSKIFSVIKKKKKDLFIFFHTCGSSRYIIPDLIESGVDILNPVQYSSKDMDTRALKRDFGKDITFWGGGIDTQRILPYGTVQEVRDEVRRRIEELAPGGGFVFTTVHNIQADVPPENIMAMWEALQEYGRY
ncbi:MAG: uroporphyrinogen decarboxylase family protein [Spirochaetota bacterium]